MSDFYKVVYTPAGNIDATLAVAASRAGGVGILNAELLDEFDLFLDQLDFLSQKAHGDFGIKMDVASDRLLDAALDYSIKGMKWLILDYEIIPSCIESVIKLKKNGVRVLAEVKSLHLPEATLEEIIDGFVLKGNESGGFVGENSCFILLQKWLKQTRLPLFIRGGVTPHVAAACSALGVAGGILDSQVLLLAESPLSQKLDPLLKNLSGNETIAVGDGEKENYFRLLVRPGLRASQNFYLKAECQNYNALRELVVGKIDWQVAENCIIPVGQDICFAGLWRKQYGHMAAVFKAIDAAIDDSLPQTVTNKPFSENSPLARFLGTALPIVQGPMARVSDCFEFAQAVSRGGGLPMLALALLKGKALNKLLDETATALGNSPWGIGVLGFAPQALLDEQLALAIKYKPDFAIIAGGRPDQAVKMEKTGIRSFLHVPSANLIPLFLQEGACRFIFEGRECGGHIGPLSSFVLWSTMVDRLLSEFNDGKATSTDIQVLFAGGIHDAVSSAIIQVLAAPLVKAGVKVGIIMGSGYLFTKEIVDSGAIVSTFQKEVVDCKHTVNLESGPGHASRCAYTPFAQEFFRKRRDMHEKNIPVDESREVLDGLIMGRLRIASKGCARVGVKGALKNFDEGRQQNEGMYMLGQLATLRGEITSISTLHHEVTEDAEALLSRQLDKITQEKVIPGAPVDVAIIGISTLLPKADRTQKYWENILNKIDAISEIPSHRWDWRLYYDEDRQAKDKSYSKWGGFLNDMPFDPTRYGMPPKSIESVDPMQLMALEVARQTLIDSGYEDRDFDRERASVIIGASGGAGDVGMQYGLRAELPRFQGELPPAVADRLPEWTEDTFAGILLNVIAGRIANRLNFGGVNFTTDAACASSLAAIYQGIAELTSRRSDFIIAGGVDTVQGPFGFMCFSKTQALSPRGKCNTFDVSSDGIVISEGIAMVGLKRVEDAERDGDRIYAVIKGIGGSSDGRAKGLTAPLPAGQLKAMNRAYQQAGFGPESVDLFEAHGTGTVAGDTAELESTTELLKKAGSGTCQAVIGSVKTLIGHTKATAGIAGMIKAALALHHHVLPPHGGVTQPNPGFLTDDCPLYLLDEPRPWLKRDNIPRRAASSAFGFGGTNFHVVLEEYTEEYRPWLRTSVSQSWPAELFLLSDNNRKGLTTQLIQIQQDFSTISNNEIRDLACNLADKWAAKDEVMAIVASDFNDLAGKIELGLNYLAGKSAELPPGIYHNSKPVKGKVAVLFSGQGSQYIDMLRELALYFPICADTLSMADQLLNDSFSKRFGEGVRLSHFIFPRGAYGQELQNAAAQALTSTDVAQPALGAVEAGLWQLMKEFGLAPDMLAGHSYGEFVALFASGCFDFETLMLLSETRGRCIVDSALSSGQELGTMAAVMASRNDVEKMLAGSDGVIVANHNGPMQSIISGSKSAIKELVEKISKTGVKVTELPVAAAFHSGFVESAQTGLVDIIEAGTWQAGKIPVYSNTTAEPHNLDIGQVKNQMAEHLVKPVEFMAEVEAMYSDGARIFLELGPKSVLSRMAANILADKPHKAIAIESDGNGIKGMLCCFAQLLCAGVKLDIKKLFAGRDCLKGNLSQVQREKPLSQHTWMLNGSGARKASEPVKQIGVRADERAATVNLKTEKSPFSVSSENKSFVSKKSISAPSRKESPTMGRQRNGPVAEDSVVMTNYFDTMRRFLETQEHIMSLYLDGSTTKRSSGARFQRLVQSQSKTMAASPELEGLQATQQPAPMAQSTEVVRQVDEDTPVQSGAAPVVPHPSDVPPNPVSIDADSQGAVVDREKMTDMFFTIIEDKTGYPRDMVGLDQNLEADLGIDSIKRIEVVGAILQTLPESYGKALGEDRTSLNTLATLNDMLDMLGELKVDEGETPPFDQAGVGSGTSIASYLPRHILEAKLEPLEKTTQTRLEQGHFLITEDTIGVAEALSAVLCEQGCTVSLLEREVLQDEASLHKWCASLNRNGDGIAGIIHLAQLGSAWLQLDAPLADWRNQIQLNEKSLFILLNHFSSELHDDAHILSASGLGGYFNHQPDKASGLSLQGGFVGLLKSLFEERSSLRVKAVDIDLAQQTSSIVEVLLSELEVAGGRQEIGYPDGNRIIFQTISKSIDESEENLEAIRDIVILATGGLRGITAEVLRELALPGNTLLLTGRSALSEHEPEELQALTTSEDLQKYFINQMRDGSQKLTPAEIQRKVKSTFAAREMRNNLEEFRSTGAIVEYYPVDVTDEDAMAQLFDNIYKKHGTINGVIHGAGVIEDKLLADKTGESWSRVVETKVIGLLLLQKYINSESLRFFTVFSSVAGRYGNSGQTDYATANELMNRLCCQLKMNWPDHVKVRSFCWGPWGQTKFGAGMVTAETEAKFAEKGVTLVSADIGSRLFKTELTREANSHVEIICGAGPWEQHEAAIGQFDKKPQTNTAALSPLLDNASLSTSPKGNQVITFSLTDNHAYLQEHCIDNVPVLPAAVALEIMVEAATSLWPGWLVIEAHDFRLMKGIELKSKEQEFKLTINPPPYGSSSGFEISCTLQSELETGNKQVHYRSVLRLEQQFPQTSVHEPQSYTDKQLTVAKAYNEWLFHGPRFQVIEEIDGLSDSGAKALVRTSRPGEWMGNIGPCNDQWDFEPGLIDAAAQMALLWARVFRNESALPVRFGRVVRYFDILPEKLYMNFNRIITDESHLVRANVYFTDIDNKVVLSIEDLECVSSEALNRVGGTAGKA